MAVFVVSFGALLLGFLLIFTLRDKKEEEIRCERCGRSVLYTTPIGQSAYLEELEMALCASCAKQLNERIDRRVEVEVAAFLQSPDS